ncbi:MAG: hypothetical protein AVDCRST_MAG70-1662 [uncultured Thermomicrobiales bacterium]|uniref:Uncharacterized protein n=1 Tax=uncultured Thermomicrobiales bacterium TaxID=1645740 RepID=A0A6J4UZZ9_9BACT|nr:MAG: hypothetical protein AVDCRST_MAG70-1662 [uncultured Thermomicrobiales bacterium]
MARWDPATQTSEEGGMTRVEVRCPACAETVRPVPIAYGMPGPEMVAAAERGEILLGGCVVSPDNPTHRCPRCHRVLWSLAESGDEGFRSHFA